MKARGTFINVAVTLAAVATLVGSLAGCGGGSESTSSPASPQNLPAAVAQAKAAGTTPDPAIVTADNVFGLNLLNTLNTPGSTHTNLSISPLSVALVMQILYNGADGPTQQGLQQALQLNGLSAQDINDANAALQASLIDPDPDVQLTIANSLWMHLASNPVLASFTQINQTYYGAEIGDLAGAPGDVNTWVSQQTNGLITQILPTDFDAASAVAVVVNALYFKGTWTTAFDPSQTAPAPFTRVDGTQVTAQMMHQGGSYDHFRGADFELLRLPYGSGRMSMIILLPDAGVSLNTLVAGLTAGSLTTSFSGLQTSSGLIAVPRFRTSYGTSLMNALTSLGMSSDSYPGIAASARLSEVEHETLVEVDENGTVAAASTGGTVTTVVGFEMTLDRPFFYAIRDDKTGLLLFLGELMDPTAS